MMRGGFNRTTVLRTPGTRMLRVGNPFIDILASTVRIDDRGQATAFVRKDQRFAGDPEVYFGMDFLVEAETDATLRLVRDDPISAHAIGRQADRLLAPFMKRVWVPAGQDAAIEDKELIAWLNRPYDKRPPLGDVNLNETRIGQILDFFGGADRFAAAARAAGDTGRSELVRVTDLSARCEQARKHGTESLAVRRAQAQARQAAGRIVSDTESYLADVRIAEELVAGLLTPRVRMVGVVCVVRGAPVGAAHGG
jgi:ATP-dependent helicase HepA